jgi:ABC-type uncharacterized transport system auxiliary subunit
MRKLFLITALVAALAGCQKQTTHLLPEPQVQEVNQFAF